MAVDTDDDRYDVWDFANGTGAEPLPESSGESSDLGYKQPAPKKKRRKSKRVNVPDLIVLEDDTSQESDSDLEIVSRLEKKRSKGIERGDSAFDELDIKIVRLPGTRVRTEEEQAAELKMRNNLLQIQRLKSQIGANIPEPEDEEEKDEADSENSDNDSDASQGENAADQNEEKVIVKIRWAPNEDPIKFRIGKTLPMEKLFGTFKSAGLKKELFEEDAELRFNFDGEDIEANQTAESLDIEDDCVIEVKW